MKKTEQWMISAIAFLLIGIILFLNISELLRKKSGGDSDMIHSFYEVEKEYFEKVVSLCAENVLKAVIKDCIT